MRAVDGSVADDMVGQLSSPVSLLFFIVSAYSSTLPEEMVVVERSVPHICRR